MNGPEKGGNSVWLSCITQVRRTYMLWYLNEVKSLLVWRSQVIPHLWDVCADLQVIIPHFNEIVHWMLMLAGETRQYVAVIRNAFEENVSSEFVYWLNGDGNSSCCLFQLNSPFLLLWYEAELWIYNSNSVARSSVHEMNESLGRSGSCRGLYMHIDFPSRGLTDSEMQMTENPGSLWQVLHINLIKTKKQKHKQKNLVSHYNSTLT